MNTRIYISSFIDVDLPEQEMWAWCFENEIYPVSVGIEDDGKNFFEFENSKQALMFKLVFVDKFNN